MRGRRLSLGWFSLFFTMACTPRERAPVTVPTAEASGARPAAAAHWDGCEEPFAVTTLPDTFIPTSKACVVRSRGSALADVLVKQNGAQPLRLALTQSDLEVFPTDQAGELAHVRVVAPLRFAGWTRVERYGVVPAADLAEGMIHAGKQTTLANARVRGETVVGELSVGGASADNVSVACSKLTTATPDAPAPELLLGTALVRPKDAWLALSSSTGAATTQRFRNLMALSKLEQTGDWVHVSASYADGSRVAGWAQASAVEAVPAGEEPVPATTGPGFCGYGCGGGASEYQVGPAQVLPQTQVHATPDGEVWAEVPAPLDAVVARRGDEPWVRLLKIAGIEEDRGCHSLEHAWVRRERVTPAAD